MQIIKVPSPENGYLNKHAELLISSYHRWTGKDLVKPEHSDGDMYRALFQAPYAVVSHNTEDIPIFNYGNQTALSVFEMDWTEFTSLASQKSAEPVNQAERERLLARVSKLGFIDDYKGVRISSTGRHFLIENATVWNVVDARGEYYGQAAVFYKWSEL
ncbi:MEKHLA domain-containing protein [Methyloprofundus sedimenti]|uniref:MEKHLA domain-containing protein n=1 Tax=Methyloprofundus sedimenti TaxID=1420851 RepID=A0A1V8M4I0_9GAMM|nr:MEKHLA domain-containing protein [Methyloprofundus sedimenti]OQK16386.1 MEKHLA domain-containing protein [Methyloprofundus sedimenti]